METTTRAISRNSSLKGLGSVAALGAGVVLVGAVLASVVGAAPATTQAQRDPLAAPALIQFRQSEHAAPAAAPDILSGSSLNEFRQSEHAAAGTTSTDPLAAPNLVQFRQSEITESGR
jgi:hypothetical protein